MSLYKYFKKAKKQKWAIGEFNFSTVEQLKGIILAAKSKSSPVILGTSENEAKFFGLEEAVALVRILENKEKFKLFLHLDHGKDLDIIKRAIDVGYDSVHFDGSFLSFEDNVKLTGEVVRYAHKKKIFVEGELGFLRGESKLFLTDAPVIKEQDLTRPEDAEDFVLKTGVDSLAVVIGNVHGMYKKMPDLDFERLKKIKSQTDVFLVLHGGSGLSISDLKKAIRFGVQKVNLNTELRIAWRKSLEKAFKNSKETKPYKISPEVIQEIKKKVEKYIKLFGSRNKI